VQSSKIPIFEPGKVPARIQGETLAYGAFSLHQAELARSSAHLEAPPGFGVQLSSAAFSLRVTKLSA
jgi:hypothetical protein